MEGQIDVVCEHHHPLKLGNSSEYSKLLDAIGDSQIVLIGEASHGTAEFYRERELITQLLIEKKNFSAICCEADYPESYSVNRYIQGTSDAKNAVMATEYYERFPRWMWRNKEVLPFIEWCKSHNSKLRKEGKGHYDLVSFHGLDIYSLVSSSSAVVDYLAKTDKKAAALARKRYGCFDTYDSDTSAYAFSARYGIAHTCENEVINVLRDLLRKRQDYIWKNVDEAGNSIPSEESQFVSEINAQVVVDAEEYYRNLLREDVKSWNIRDTHMAKIFCQIRDFLRKQSGKQVKLVVWAHNSHVGDARYTEMGQRRGEINVGQLLREQFPGEVFNIGFSTYTGTVMAADEWDSPGQVKMVNPGRSDSWEGLLHEAAVKLGQPNFMLKFTGPENARLAKVFARTRLQRAIGVIYRPDTERWSHYFFAQPARQFDVILHLDETSAVLPVEDISHPEVEHEVPDTFPSGV
ncbi:uncharacterized protein VTP21DRAFT_3940 [Calcarisporiella thermophila]|uniref:uncharacterized protein n=1 Tax=Calcarisporiella thermophila TaxID=911321 RepID=UPI003741E9ED